MRDINSHGGRHVKLRTRKLAVFVTCLGVAAAFPVLSSADKGGHPNSHSKPCKTHKTKKKPHPSNLGASKGKKCGWNGPTTTVVSTVATPTGSTSTETETNITSSTTVSTP
jgi:hypothetical protein